MGKAPKRLTKTVDDRFVLRCRAGPGELREEVWEDEEGNAARYNLTFINHLLWPSNNGRVLGYDNAHGQCERHYCGKVEAVEFSGLDTLRETFFAELQVLKG